MYHYITLVMASDWRNCSVNIQLHTATNNSKFPILGIILDVRGIPPFVSVSKLWEQIIQIISKSFLVYIYYVDTFKIDCSSPDYLAFIKKIDLLILLAPYYSIDRSLKNIPVIIFALGSLQKGGHWLYRNRSTFCTGDSLIVNCLACENIFKELVGTSAMKSYVVPLAIDPQIFYPRANKAMLRQKYNIPNESFVLLYSGRINIQKNCHLLLSVLREIRKKFDVHLVLVGFFDNFYISEFSPQSPPDSRATFERLVDSFGLAEHITLLKHQDDPSNLAEILSTANVGINLSTLINENFGFSQVEMQACGIPIICSDWGGMKDTVLHGKTGFRADTILTDYGVRVNFEQAAHYIEELISNPDLQQSMRRNAIEHSKKYMYPAFSKRISEIIYDTLARNKQDDHRNDFVYHPIMKRFYEMLQNTHRNSHDLIWEHLHPLLDFEHYRLVVSKCATRQAQDLQWQFDTRIAKALDWRMRDCGHIVFLDPRWNPAFELIGGFELTGLEMKLLWQIDHKSRIVGELSTDWPWQTLLDHLSSLASKGMILQSEYNLEGIHIIFDCSQRN